MWDFKALLKSLNCFLFSESQLPSTPFSLYTLVRAATHKLGDCDTGHRRNKSPVVSDSLFCYLGSGDMDSLRPVLEEKGLGA